MPHLFDHSFADITIALQVPDCASMASAFIVFTRTCLDRRVVEAKYGTPCSLASSCHEVEC